MTMLRRLAPESSAEPPNEALMRELGSVESRIVSGAAFRDDATNDVTSDAHGKGQTSAANREGQTSAANREGQTSAASREGQTSAASREGQTSAASREGQTSATNRGDGQRQKRDARGASGVELRGRSAPTTSPVARRRTSAW